MLKTCKVCGDPFHSYFPSQVCCSYKCGERMDKGEKIKIKGIDEISRRGINYGGIVLKIKEAY